MTRHSKFEALQQSLSEEISSLQKKLNDEKGMWCHHVGLSYNYTTLQGRTLDPSHTEYTYRSFLLSYNYTTLQGRTLDPSYTEETRSVE